MYNDFRLKSYEEFKMNDKLYIVVPCYNEEEVLPLTIPNLVEMTKSMAEENLISEDSKIIFVNDGSRDKTWEIIEKAVSESPYIVGINLAGNVGHQNALVAGLEYAAERCDMCISIDADLQDDTDAIKSMVEKYHEGADIVFGVRSDRKSDTFFKRFTAHCFYKFMNILGVKSVYNHADYRLMSKQSLKALSGYKETNLFLRGIIAQMGFVTDTVYYSRKERAAGKSKYPFRKMLSFAWNGITSFSIKPISALMALGFIIILGCIVALGYSLISYARGNVIPGWTSLMISIWFLGGVQLFSIGMIGQYIGKTYLESKRRPRYHIKEIKKNPED